MHDLPGHHGDVLALPVAQSRQRHPVVRGLRDSCTGGRRRGASNALLPYALAWGLVLVAGGVLRPLPCCRMP
eukprot:365863-Chlamydomonas_euryale.AAC.10